MKKIISFIGAFVTIGLVMLALSSPAMAITLNYAALTGSTVTFTGTGDTFVFNPEGGGFDFNITSGGSVGPGSANGLNGNIEGTFTIGSITTPGGLQSAGVTGLGTLSIFDGGVNTLTASLAWVDIFTFSGVGGINAGGSVNLTGIAYAGANADLIALATLGTGSGSTNATFQFIPAKSLTDLTTDGQIKSTSYSGSIAVPEPTSLLLLGSGLAGLGLWGRKRLKG